MEFKIDWVVIVRRIALVLVLMLAVAHSLVIASPEISPELRTLMGADLMMNIFMIIGFMATLEGKP